MRKIAIVLCELVALGMALPVNAKEGSKQPVQVTQTEHASFAPGGTIRIDQSYGDLHVEGWDQPEVEITVIKSLPYDYKPKGPDEATKHLDSVSVVMEHKSNAELVIATNLPRHRSVLSPFSAHNIHGGVSVEYEIHVHRDSKLAIHHGTGSVLVSNITGNIEATGGRGDIMLMLADAGSYTIDAKSKFGTVTSDFEDTPHINRYLLGERYATADSPSSRRIHLRMGFGGITIKAVPPEAFVAESAH